MEERDQHVGNQNSGVTGIEGGVERQQGQRAHRASSEPLSAAKQFVVDGADLLQDLPCALIIGEIVAYLLHVGLGIVHLRVLVGTADR